MFTGMEQQVALDLQILHDKCSILGWNQLGQVKVKSERRDK